jgi:hypothetical protein
LRRGYWTKEKCKEVALLCKYRTEFSKNYKVAYVTSSKKGWLSEICSHKEASDLEIYYVEEYKKMGFNILNKIKAGGLGGNLIKWNYETCKEEASKYSNRTTFCKNKRKAYDKCVREGWINEFFKK